MNFKVSDDLLACLKSNQELQIIIIEEINKIDEKISEMKKYLKNEKNIKFSNYFKIRRNIFSDCPLVVPTCKWTKVEDKQIYNIGLNSLKSDRFPLEIFEFLQIKYDKIYKPGFVEINPLEFYHLCSPKKSLFQVYQRWINFLHPSISKSHFSKLENSKLVRYAPVYGFRNWHLIALQMNSIRRPWQCLMQYQQCINKDMWCSEWNQTDDKILLEKTKEYIDIDWTDISKYFRWKTNEQCRLRYYYLIYGHSPSGIEIFDEYLKGNLSSLGILPTFMIKFNKSSRYYRWSKNEDEYLIDAYNQFKNSYGKWNKISQILQGCRSKHAVIKRFSIICPEENVKRLFDEVWSRKGFISNYSFGERNKPSFEDLGIFGLPNIPQNQIKKLKDRILGNFSKKDCPSAIILTDHGYISDFNEAYEIWFQEFTHIQDLGLKIINIKNPEVCGLFSELNLISNSWISFNPHNYNNMETWKKNIHEIFNKIKNIEDKINNFN